jgi:hypothetical protein
MAKKKKRIHPLPQHSKAAIGARVKYCNHDAWFVADIFDFSGVCVVRASFTPKTTMDFETKLHRPATQCTHVVSDFPFPGFWRPDLGMFVVPRAQLQVLLKEGE